MFKKEKLINLIIILLILLFFPATSFPATFGDIRLSYIEGDVQINIETSREWMAASTNTPLYEGDRIWVPDFGKAELHFRKGTIVRLNEQTSLDILNYDTDSLHLNLNRGSLYINYRDIQNNILQIDTPLATIRTYTKAVFRVDVPENNHIYISVYRGVVYVDYRKGRQMVRGGTKFIFDEYYRDETLPLGPPDAWTRWNFSRDREIYESYRSERYLPEELRFYSYEFDRYGRWVYVRDYGYCWTPYLTISIGWAPYKKGRWVWIRGDYVWISYEPWGWVPYHYGRWAFVINIGWCWVPPLRGYVYWGPGYVGWVYTPTYIAWVPLAPGEIYYGYGYYGPHSVNLINVNINRVVIKEKYKNAIVKDGVTVIHRDTFITGKEKKIRIKENPFLVERVHPGRPEIKPERSTKMPIIRDISETKLPPREIMESDINIIKQRNLLRKQRDPQMLEKMGESDIKGDDRRSITPLNGKFEREERTNIPEVKPEIRDRQVPDYKIRERTPPEIRKENLQEPPTPTRDEKPELKKERIREITPPNIKPDDERDGAPVHSIKGKQKEKN